MSSITDLILKQVQSAASNSNLDNKVLNGLSDSVLNSLKQTATSANGIAQITELLKGKTSAESSPVTNLASSIFSSQIASKLGLSASTTSTATNLLPLIINGIVSAINKKGSGIDLSSVLSSLGGASSSSSTLGKLAGSLGKLFKK